MAQALGAGLNVGLLGDGVYGEGVAGGAFLHAQDDAAFGSGEESGGEDLAVRIPDFEPGVGDDGCAEGIPEMDGLGIRGHAGL